MNDRLVDAHVKGARMNATDNATHVDAESSTEAKWRRNTRRHTRCVMVLPDDLAGKRVLDIECRKGLGAFKIADRVGEGGFVVGTDSSAEKIAAAQELAPQQHWAGDAWRQHMRLVQADPTDLLAAGIEDASIDVVVVNSVLNFASDRLKAFLLPMSLRRLPQKRSLYASCRKLASLAGNSSTNSPSSLSAKTRSSHSLA